MRALIRTLRAPDSRGWVSLVRDRLDPLQLQTTAAIHLRAAPDADVPLTAEAQHALLCVLDESLHNALRHACATDIYVETAREEAWLLLGVCDNGIGFDATQAPQPDVPRGVGMDSMRDRVRLLGGHLSVHSEPGKGTTVTARVPLSSTVRVGSGEESESEEGDELEEGDDEQ